MEIGNLSTFRQRWWDHDHPMICQNAKEQIAVHQELEILNLDRLKSTIL